MSDEQTYEVKVRQEVVVTAEVFEIEAGSRKEALAKAHEFVEAEKDYDPNKITLEAELKPEPEEELTTPTQEEEK